MLLLLKPALAPSMGRLEVVALPSSSFALCSWDSDERACRWTGEIAAVEAKALRKVKGDEKVHPTSIQAIREPPQVKGNPHLQLPSLLQSQLQLHLHLYFQSRCRCNNRK